MRLRRTKVVTYPSRYINLLYFISCSITPSSSDAYVLYGCPLVHNCVVCVRAIFRVACSLASSLPPPLLLIVRPQPRMAAASIEVQNNLASGGMREGEEGRGGGGLPGIPPLPSARPSVIARLLSPLASGWDLHSLLEFFYTPIESTRRAELIRSLCGLTFEGKRAGHSAGGNANG